MAEQLTEAPSSNTFLEFPLQLDLETLTADIAILGIPYGAPYHGATEPNDQSRAPDALRGAAMDVDYTLDHYDFDLGGPLLNERDIAVVDCGNVIGDVSDYKAHYARAEQAARKIFAAGATLISLGGDHGIPIPVLRALECLNQKITLVHIDAHLDWRDEIGGETEGYSSPIRRASEMPWIGDIIQIGMRGIGSARQQEVDDARAHGAEIISAYEMHQIGMQAILDRVPDGGPYYVSIDADGVDPTIMPAVLAPTPGGLDWLQLHKFVHGLVAKGQVVGLDLVEIAPSYDIRGLTMFYAERLLCNFIGAIVRA